MSNYGIGDNPYDREIVRRIQALELRKNEYGEPDKFLKGKYITSPHLRYPMIGGNDLEGGKMFNIFEPVLHGAKEAGKKAVHFLGPSVKHVGLKSAEKVGEKMVKKLLNDMVESKSGAGMVDPTLKRSRNHILSGNTARYPQYHALELKKLDDMEGGNLFGDIAHTLHKGTKKLVKVAKPVLGHVAQKALPLAERLATDAMVGAVMSGMGHDEEKPKKKRGRPKGSKNKKGGAIIKDIKKGSKMAKKAIKKAEKLPVKEIKEVAEKIKDVLEGGEVKRKRGRPKGSKNKKGGAMITDADIKKASKVLKKTVEVVFPEKVIEELEEKEDKPKKKRGRPKKAEKKEEKPNLDDYFLKKKGGAVKKEKKGKAGKVDGRKKRAEIVKKVMKEKGLKMVEASKYVKEHGLY